MGYLRKKNDDGRTYYAYVEKARVDGEPADAVNIYLGSAKKILKLVRGDAPDDTRIPVKTFEFGRTAALLAVDEEIGFRNIVNRTITKRCQKGLSFGDYLLITIFGRWCGPLSKTATAEHFSKSFLNFGTNLPHKVNAQNIIAHMKYLDEETIRKIETLLGKRLIQLGHTPDMVVWDTTNNYTFIDKGEEIPKKGKSKQGRHNKNLIGLGLAASGENLPFFHVTVPGNTSDATLFSTVVDDIIARLIVIGANPKDVVLVFDKGNNNKETFARIEKDISILGSLKKNQVPDMFDIPLDEFKPLYTTTKKTEITGISAVREVNDRLYKIVLTYNPDTRKRQMKTYESTKILLLEKLQEIKVSVERTGKGRKTTIESALKRAVKAIPEQYASVFKYKVFQRKGMKTFNYWTDTDAETKLAAGFGKTAVFTDKMDWTDQKIAMTYNRKAFIEDDFHWLTDKLLIPLTPIWHRKDKKIRVHIFLCVVGLFFVRYLSQKVSDLGISDKTVMEELGEIRCGLTVNKNLSSSELVVEEMTPLQARLFSRLDLARYLKGNSLG